MNKAVFIAAALSVCAGLAHAQSVELRIIERTGRTAVTGPADAELNCAVQARVVGGTQVFALASFTFNIRIVGEPESSGSLARGLINNPDHTYTSAIATSSTIGFGGIAAQFSYLAGINATFNGLINTSGGQFTNGPDQEIGAIAGQAGGTALLGTPGIDADGDGNPDTWWGNGSGATPSGGTIVPINTGALPTYFGANGTWIDVYRFRYTVSEFSSRTLVLRLQGATASVGSQLVYRGGVWGCEPVIPAPASWPDLLISVDSPAPGACCDLASGACAVGLPADCTGVFLPLSSCSPSACAMPGVCCDSAGQCSLGIQSQCAGAWTAAGSCSPNVCPQPGKCCVGFACSIRVPTNCTGTWQQGEACNTGMCGIGSCCDLSTGSCAFVYPSECAAPLVYGDGVACINYSCPVSACCDPLTHACTAIGNWQSCSAGMLLESNQSCSSRTCPGVLCCNTLLGTCTVIGPQGSCSAGSVPYGPGSVCNPYPCPRQACCNTLTGACTTVGAAGTCPAPTVPQGNPTCSVLCPAIPCCRTDNGTCIIVGPVGACPAGSVSQAPVTSCATVSCPRLACCNPLNAGCSLIGPAGTCFAGAAVLGPATTCSPNPCPVVACCDTRSTFCTVIGSAGTCPTNMISSGPGSACTPNTCPATGRCCLPSGGCTVVTPPGCTTGVWTAQSGTTCSIANCPQPGRCCSAASSCTYVLQSACAGTWMVYCCCSTTVCTSLGACCTGMACTIGTHTDCEGTARVFHGIGSVCGTAANPIACCPANFNHVDGVTSLDLFDFLNAWFAHNLAADISGDGALSITDVMQFLDAWMRGC